MKEATISHTAKKVGISIETIRYYERIGLIFQPLKPISGYRIYDNQILSRLHFIKRAKSLGFSLTEISEILNLGTEECTETKKYALGKLQEINKKIKDLQLIALRLDELVQACDSNPEYEVCPIISSIIDSD